jgi:hypothetical protein
MSDNRLYGTTPSEIFPGFTFEVLHSFERGDSGRTIAVPPTFFRPRKPRSQKAFSGALPWMSATWANTPLSVSPSYSLRKPFAPTTMQLVLVITMAALAPNSYFLCSLPLLTQQTSGSWKL